MDTEEIADKVEEAVEAVTAQAEAAEKTEEVIAESVAVAEAAKATEAVVATAESAVALANVTAATAVAQAASEINEKDADISWLKQNVTQLENSLNNQAEMTLSLNSKVEKIAEILEAIVASSTPPQSTMSETLEAETILPADQDSQSVAEEGRVSQEQSQAQAKKRRVWASELRAIKTS